MPTVIIIGASHAASEAVASLRKHGWEGRIILFGDENRLPYHRPPLSKAYFNDELSAENLLIRRATVYEKAAVECHLNTRITEINRKEHYVVSDHGEQFQYDKLIIATGTRPRKLTVPGCDTAPLYHLRNLADVDAIKIALQDKKRLLIIGAGYIGLELAASAVNKGLQTTVLELQDRVLERVTSPVVSDFFQQLHGDAGVNIQLQCGVSAFQYHSGEHQAVLSNGEVLGFDCAVVGIGVLPNDALASAAALHCDNGIVVDECCRTNDPDIFAVGDCCNHPNLFYNKRIRLESVPNAVEQAKTAALSICGQPKAYDSLPWFWSDQFDIKLQTAGLFHGFDRYVIRGNIAERKFAVFYLSGDNVIAADVINNPLDFMMAKRLISEKISVTESQLTDTQQPLKDLL